MAGKRIHIVGSAGAGKSTLASHLAAQLQCPLVELDELYWRPGWQAAPLEEFRAEVTASLAPDRWVACGNYRIVRDITWGRADTLVWLDYPLPLIFLRLWRRTWARLVTQEELWGGNRESWRGQFWSRDSLFLYVLRTHNQRRREIESTLREPQYAHLEVLRWRQAREVKAWLALG